VNAPWFVSEEPRVGGYAIESAEHGVIAVSIQRDAAPVPNGRKGISDKQAREHARLMAAAPELLEALRETTALLEACGDSNRVTKLARAAITKARGEA
jgi:hypothetical protein